MVWARFKIIVILFLILFFSIRPICVSSYVHIELNEPYPGFVEWNETVSHRLFIEINTLTSLNITLTPDSKSNADIKIEYWDSGHSNIIESSDKNNYSKPEHIYVPLAKTGEIFIDVYTINDVNTSYTLLVEEVKIDPTPVVLVFVVIFGLIFSFVFIFLFYNRVYEFFSRWKFRRDYKKRFGREYNPTDLSNYPIASQRVGNSEDIDGGLVYSVDIRKKNKTEKIIKWGLAIGWIIMLVAGIITIGQYSGWL